MPRLYWRMLLFVLLSACEPAVVHITEDAGGSRPSPWVQVSEVESGDTIKLQDGQTVRYLGIRAPQKGEMLFEEARQANEWLLRQGKAILQVGESQKDSQGRVLAYVFSPAKGVFCFVNKELLQFGYARVAETPVHKYSGEFLQLQREAQQAKRGIWAKGMGSAP